MAGLSYSFYQIIYVPLFLAFFFIRTPERVNMIKLGMINKIFFLIEFILIFFMLYMSVVFISVPSVVFSTLSFLSLLSLVSLTVLMIKTMMVNSSIQIKFIYASHLGIFVILLALVSLVVPSIGSYSREVPPYSIFLLGIVILIPYLHLMIIQQFFTKNIVEK